MSIASTGSRTRATLLVTATATLLALLPGAFTPALAAEPAHVSFTFEGCRGSVGISFPISGPFVCPDNQYTTGNLGKGWNELDLVPHRVTTKLGKQDSASTEYSFNIVADREEAGDPGYDMISAPVVNTALSHGSCAISSTAQDDKVPGIGGTDRSIYRTVTVNQPTGSTCVFDWYQRLAFDSHLYPGSSLHSNLTQEDFSTGGIGARDVSIPVAEILPPEFSKRMQAVQGAAHDWLLTKEATPTTLTFADTCEDTTGAHQRMVEIRVSWQKLQANPDGPILISTVLTVVNHAHRPLKVDLKDDIFDGITLLDTWMMDDVTIDPGSHEFTHTFEWQNPTEDPELNDLARARFRDPLDPGTVVGTLMAAASTDVAFTGPTSNATATITDVESITGDGLTFSVAPVSVGAFVGYVANTPTTGPVTWRLEDTSTSGSVTFTKTIYVDGARETTGILSDEATLEGSDGLIREAEASTSITAEAFFDLVIDKTLAPKPVDEDLTFEFQVTGPNGFDETVFITIPAGDTNEEATLSNLEPGDYSVEEKPTSVFPGQTEYVSLTLPREPGECSETARFLNEYRPASVRVIKLVESVNPATTVEGWEFCLSGPALAEPECKDTDADGELVFDAVIDESGTYTITETTQPGFDVSPDDTCTFDVDLPDDGGRVFSCTFTNVERGMVEVIKTTDGSPAGAGEFTFTLDGEGVSITDSTDAAGIVDFGGVKLVPGTYTVCEIDLPAGWSSTWTLDGSSVTPVNPDHPEDLGNRCITFEIQPGQSRTIAVDNVPPPGGNARTIGYWRNWSTCTNGRQAETAAKNGGSANGFWLIDDVLPQLIGDLNVDTCEEAVSILSKESLDGKKRAGDAAYGLAAQLLAYRANIAAGAGSCSAADSAAADGQALLDSINFDGTGGYLTSKHRTMRAQRMAGLGYASTLDSYNNNTLC